MSFLWIYHQKNCSDDHGNSSDDVSYESTDKSTCLGKFSACCDFSSYAEDFPVWTKYVLVVRVAAFKCGAVYNSVSVCFDLFVTDDPVIIF